MEVLVRLSRTVTLPDVEMKKVSFAGFRQLEPLSVVRDGSVETMTRNLVRGDRCKAGKVEQRVRGEQDMATPAGVSDAGCQY